MKTKALLTALALTVSAAGGFAQDKLMSPQFGDTAVNAENTQQQYHQLTNRLIAEYLETGKLSRDSIQAYQLLSGIAKRNGIRVERIALRAADERSLGPALVIARLESLGLGYDRIYHLQLRKE